MLFLYNIEITQTPVRKNVRRQLTRALDGGH